MDNKAAMQQTQGIGFMHNIRLVPLFSFILSGILVLFALSSGLAGYFLMQADRDQQDVTQEIQVRMGLSNSSNNLRVARIKLIHAGAASRIAEMEDVKTNIAEAEKRIKQSQENFKQYMDRPVKTEADLTLDNDLTARFDAYTAGLQPMLKYAKNGMFEAIINHESEQARQLEIVAGVRPARFRDRLGRAGLRRREVRGEHARGALPQNGERLRGWVDQIPEQQGA